MDDEAATQPPAVRPRRWIRIGLAVLAVIVIMVVAAWTKRHAVAEFALGRAAAAAGVESLTLTIERLGLEGATVSDIALGDAQRIARIDARYSLRGLWRGSVGHLDVRGLSLRGRVGENGLTLPGLPIPAASNSDSELTIPIRSIRFQDARLELDTPQGDHSVAADGIVDTLDGKNSDLEASFTVKSAFGSVKAHVDAARFGSGEAVGQIVIEDGDIAVATVDASGIRGKVQVISLSDGALDADANLDIKALSVANETLGAARISLGGRTTNGTDAAMEATLRSRNGTVGIAGTLSRSEANGIAATARYTLALVHAALNAKAEGSARIAVTPDGRLVGELEVDDGEAAQDENRISGIAGRTTFIRTSGGALQGAADLSFKTIETHGIQTESGSVSLMLDDKRVAADAALRWPGGTLSLHAAGPPDGAVQFETTGQLTNFQPLTRLHDGFAAKGRATFEVVGKLDPPGGVLAAMEAQPLALIDHVDANGQLDVDMQEADLPGMAQGVALKGRVALSKTGQDLLITTPGTTTMVGTLRDAALARLPEALRTRLTGPLDFAIRPHGGRDAIVSVTPDLTGIAISTDLTAKMTAKDAILSAAGRVTARLGVEDAPSFVTTPRMALDYRVREKGRGDLTGQVTLRNLKYEGDQLESDFDLASTFNGRVDDLVEPLTANAKLSGRISMQGNSVVARIGRGGSLSFDRVAVPDTVAIDTPVSATLSAPARARIDLREGLPSLDYSAALALSATTVRAKTGDSWLEASLSRVPIKTEGAAGTHKIALQAASLEVPEYEVEISGIALNLEAGNDLQAEIAVDKIEHLGKPTLVTPLRFTGNATGSGQKVAFDGRVFDPSERISVALSGQHDRQSRRGDLSIDAQKLVFLPTVLQPVQLFPVLGGTMREVDGEVDMRANFAWHGDSVSSDMELLVDAKLIKADEFTFENAAAVVRFDSLMPPSTPPKQEVSIGLLDVGVPMLNGRLEFQLNRDGTVRAALRELDFFGGRIETDDFVIPANFDGFTVPLEVNGVELDSLLALAQSGDLTATGTLNGQIPVAIEAGEVAIRNGVLESAPGGGSIRYKPTAVGPSLSEANEGMKLFLQIVDDFQYDKVRVTLDEDAQDEVAFRFKIEGRNQAVYKGIPVELNVSMDGPLRKILTQGLKTYKLPERLLSGMERFKDKR